MPILIVPLLPLLLIPSPTGEADEAGEAGEADERESEVATDGDIDSSPLERGRLDSPVDGGSTTGKAVGSFNTNEFERERAGLDSKVEEVEGEIIAVDVEAETVGHSLLSLLPAVLVLPVLVLAEVLSPTAFDAAAK